MAQTRTRQAVPGLPALRPRWWLARPLFLVGGAVALAVLLAVAWYVVSPLVIRSRLEETAPAAGQVVARGAFADRDAVHRGSGTASVERTPDGRTSLRLDQFKVTNGPDLFVYLTPAAVPTSHEDVVSGALQVGRLKASEGAFSYELPPGTDISTFRSAVIYCYQFRFIFSVAPLSAA